MLLFSNITGNFTLKKTNNYSMEVEWFTKFMYSNPICQRTPGRLLKYLQLLRALWQRRRFFAPKIKNIAVLLVGNQQDTYLAFLRYGRFYPSYMYIGAFAACTMPCIHRILHHGKSVLSQSFAKLCCFTPLYFGYYRQIKKYKNPHNMIGV